MLLTELKNLLRARGFGSSDVNDVLVLSILQHHTQPLFITGNQSLMLEVGEPAVNIDRGGWNGTSQ